MDTVRFGRTEAQVSRVALGTWSHGGPNKVGTINVGWTGFDGAAQARSLVAAWEAGITHWDTADVYGSGRSESLIGEVWGAVPREEIFLATKVGWDRGPHDHAYHPDWVQHQIDASLERLRTDHIDLYYLHHCDFGEGGVYRDDAVEVILRARDAGKIRFIGLSDWSDARIMAHIDAVDPDAVQPYRNVVHDSWESSGLAAWVRDHDAGVAFFSPIRHGLLLGKYDRPTTFEDGDHRSRDRWFQDAGILAGLKDRRDALEARFGAGVGPALRGLLMTLLDDASTGCVLLGQRSPAQVTAAAVAGQAISPEDAAWVRALYADLRETP